MANSNLEKAKDENLTLSKGLYEEGRILVCIKMAIEKQLENEPETDLANLLPNIENLANTLLYKSNYYR